MLLAEQATSDQVVENMGLTAAGTLVTNGMTVALLVIEVRQLMVSQLMVITTS